MADHSGLRGRLRAALPPRPVGWYYLYMVTASAGLMVPIWVVYLRSGGLSYAEITFLDAVWWLGIVAGELPTGYVGDRIGWRNSLVVGHALTIVGVVSMGLTTSFPVLSAVYLLWALGSTLQSGSRDAWLYELLERRLDSDAFTRVRGRGQALQLSAGAGAAVIGGAIAVWGLSYPFFATGGVRLVGLVALLALPTVAVDADQRLTVGEMRSVLGQLLAPSIRWTVAGAALVLGIVAAVARLTQPISLQWISVPQLGLLYAAFTGVAALASARSEWVRERIGLQGWLLGGAAGLSVLFVGTLALPLVALPALFALRIVRVVLRPVLSQHVNDRIETTGRATTLSGVSMAISLASAPLAVGVGAITDRVGPMDAMAVAGGGLITGVLAVAILNGVGNPLSSGAGAEAD